MPLIWESSSFGGTPIAYPLPATSSVYWSSSVALSGSDTSHISLSYYEMGAPSSSIDLEYLGGELIVTWSQTTTMFPGFFSGIYEMQGEDEPEPPPPTTSFDDSELEININGIIYEYSLVSSSYIRRGIFVNESSGSPQISMEPVEQDPDQVFSGDMWLLSSSVYSDGAGGLRFANEDQSGNTYVTRVVTSRITETTYESSVSRMSSVNAPRGLVIDAKSFVANRWFVTVNSGSISGSGWMNAPWSGGIHMPDEDTVAVYGINKDFSVPSGSLIVSGTTTINGIEYQWPTSAPSTNDVLTVDSVGAVVNLKWDAASGGGGGGSDTASYAHTAAFAVEAETVEFQKYTFTASVAVVPEYVVVSSGSQHLSTGVYIVNIDVDNGENDNEVYTGQMAWFAGNTNSTGSDEVTLHRMGVSPGSQSIYLRTRRRTGNVPGYMELGASEPSNTSSYYFTCIPIF